MLTLILLNAQIYQALESVIMNHRVHYIHDLGLSYFYRIKAMSLITADQLQWTIYVKIKSRVYMCIKKLAQNFPGLLISHQVNGNVYLSYLYFTHSLLQVRVTQIQQQLSGVNISADFSICIKYASIPFASQGHKDFDHNENSFTLKQSG